MKSFFDAIKFMDTTEDKNVQTFSAKQKKYLKGLGHHLSPVILVGKDGLSTKLIEAASLELDHHELIKVKIGKNSGVDKHDAVLKLTEACSCALIQLIGKTLLLYKENKQKPKEERITPPKS